jgi:chromosomal replication initiator protein
LAAFAEDFAAVAPKTEESRRAPHPGPFDSNASIVRIKSSRGKSWKERRAKDAKEVTKDDREIVSALRSALAGKVGQERFDLWFGAAARLDYDGRTLRIGAPNAFFLDWIRCNFRRAIEDACCETLGAGVALEFHLDAASGENKSNAMQTAAHDDTTGGAAPAVRSASPERPAVPSPRSAPAAAPSRRRFATLETFVAGEANRLAIASAQRVVRRPGQVTPLMFCGPTGVGKTHLLEGIWTAARRSAGRLTALYLSAEQFTTQFLEALRGSGLPNFRRKYRSVGMLVLDDLQFFVGKRATQVELLHTIDTFLGEERQLVFAADRSPAELPELGAELVTRLTSGLVCCIEPPDFDTRLGVLEQMAKRMNMHVPAEVRQFIASRLTRHARELSGALCRLLATSESLGRPISLAMAEQALADLVGHSGRAVRLPDIQKAVCDVFGLEPASLQSEVKGKRVSHPRMLAMWLARKHTRAALSEIGYFFGRRSHSTVLSAQKRVDGWMAAGQPLDLPERRWPVDDAIRQVERRLAAG